MKNLFYVFISFLGGAIIPLQLAMVQAFRNTTHATQIQATFYLYLGGMVASFFLSLILSGNIKPPIASSASWWMWLTGFVGVFYILFMFISAPHIGSENTLLWIFLGQMYFSVIISQTHLWGLVVREFNTLKLLGLVIVTIGGVIMLYAETFE